MRHRPADTISPWPLIAAPKRLTVIAPVDEASLLERASRGEADALEALYRQHHAAVRAFAQRLLGCPDAAEDLVQEVFIRVPGMLRRFRGQSSVRTFLLGAVANRCRNHVRSAARRRAAHARAETLGTRGSVEAADAELLRKQHAEALSRALDRLPLRQRLAFVLVAVEQHSHAEAAAVLGVPEGTVSTRCFHARKKLRQLLEKERP